MNKEDRRKQSDWVVIKPSDVKPLTPEWFALKFLTDWTADDIRLAIKKNIVIDMTPFWGYVEDLIVNNILEWFKKYRPDLYDALNTEEGVGWLRMNIRRMIQI